VWGRRDGAVSIVTKLRAGRSGVRIAAVTRDIYLLQNAHPSAYSVGIGFLSRGVKRPGVSMTIHLHVEQRVRMSPAMTPTAPKCLHCADRDNLTFYMLL
jgi:hypothetical protein